VAQGHSGWFQERGSNTELVTGVRRQVPSLERNHRKITFCLKGIRFSLIPGAIAGSAKSESAAIH
jgi:hypothetical protein